MVSAFLLLSPNQSSLRVPTAFGFPKLVVFEGL